MNHRAMNHRAMKHRTVHPIPARPRQAPKPTHGLLLILTVAVLGLVVAGLTGCASTAPQPGTVRPGTGDLAFRLLWSGSADLDLYVVSALGEPIDYVRRTAPSQGTLDVDCNVGESRCPEPMENIFWPRNTAPPGDYRVWIVLADPKGLTEDDEYRLLALAHGAVAWERRGLVRDLARGFSPVQLRYP
ncbi:MAG: hypothetical protein SX243_25975 [Acidobacteriota bacterium]|nr:hypothetical protein [Acidobacteriota bacterium]